MFTKEHKNKISQALKGRHLSEEHKRSISESLKRMGHKPPSPLGTKRPGRKLTDATKLAISQALKGRKYPHINRSGPNSPSWIVDRTKVKRYWTERDNPEYKRWRMAVYLRDGFHCRILDEKCVGRIEAHHILGWTNFPELRYKTNNGITLCHFHHPRKRVDERRLAPVFNELVRSNKY